MQVRQERPEDLQRRVFLETALLFTVPDGDGTRAIHTPLVQARIGDTTTLLIIDSGATEPVFTAALARAIGAKLQPAEPGTDHAGQSVPSWSMTENAILNLGGRALTLDSPVVIEGPAPFERWGIGGFLSPQALHPTATVVIDLRSNLLSLVEGALEDISREVSARHADLSGLSLPRVDVEGDALRLVIVEAALKPSAAVRLMLNTGGNEAEIAPYAMSGPLDGPEGVRGRGLSGAPVMGLTRSDQRLTIGGASIALPEVTVREQSAAYDAQLGMAALRDTVLVVSPRRDLPVGWWIPAR